MDGSKYVSIIQLLGLLSKMDLLLSRLGAKREGNTHPFYPLMLPPGTIAQNKPVGPVRGPDSPSTHRSVFESTAASCKTEINDDVAVLMEAPGQGVNHKRRISYQKNELHEPTNDQLSGYLNDRIEIIEINTDETEETNSESHQKGTFTCQKNMKKFQEKIISNI